MLHLMESNDDGYAQIRQDRRDAELKIYQSRVNTLSSHCRRCGYATSQVRSRSVHIVTWDFCHELELPILRCDRCVL